MRQSRMCQSRIIQKAFLLLFLFFYPVGISADAEGSYSIQTATYTPISLPYAKKHMAAMSAALKKEKPYEFQIKPAGKYLAVRISGFNGRSEALEFLKKVKTLVPDAFVLKEDNPDAVPVKKEARNLRNDGFKPVPVQKDDEAVKKIEILWKKNDEARETGKAEPVKSNETDILFKDVSSYYSREQYGKAAEMLKKGIERWPDNPDLYAWYGATLINMKYHDKALQQYKKAVEISPDVSDYHAGVGLSLVNIYMDRAKESIEAFNKALQIDPNNVSALEGLGFVYASIGKKDLASEVYNRLRLIDKGAASRLYQAITQEINWELK